jgi:hypothetical protein
MPGWHHDGAFKPKPCAVCGTEFKPRSGYNRFCSDTCKGKWKYLSGQVTTETQYKKISGNWERYFSRLMARKRRENISRDDLLDLLERQGGRCALTGEVLTCKLEKGVVCPTNASIDRIDAGGPYTKENIQLVCVAMNKLRLDKSIEEFVAWCRKVVEKYDDRTPTRLQT